MNTNPLNKNSENMETRLAGDMGAIAATQSNIMELRRVVLANLLWEDKAYVDGASVRDRIKELMPMCDAEQVYNLAVECRVLQKLRHTPLYMCVLMCQLPECRQYVSKALPQIITRADMLYDFLKMYWLENGEHAPIANCAKKGLAEAFHNFNEYKFAKYDRDGDVKLRDVMFLTHPKARDEKEQELFTKIANRTLETPITWETELSAGKDKKETWTRLITEGKLGDMAMLRNLRNMKDALVDKTVIEQGIRNMKGSMLLPLDFVKAAENAPEFKSDINEAMLKAYANIPKLPGRTLFIVDCSGSMSQRISGKSNYSRHTVARAMAMFAASQCEEFELVLTAGDDYKSEHSSLYIPYPPKGFDLITHIDDMSSAVGWGGIFTGQCLNWCKKQDFANRPFDRIIVFSDSQDCDNYNTPIMPFGTHNYIVDVSSEKHGINYQGVWDAEVSGWSEHFLTYIAALEGIENTFEE